MRSKICILYCYLLFATVSRGYSQDVIFLHHSTGGNVYSQGDVASLIASYNETNGKSIQVIERSYPNTPWSWSNYPYDYWKLWIGGSCNSTESGIECLNTLVADYDMIIFKHCFPGADLLPDTGIPDVSSSTRTLENYKAQYRALRSLIDTYPETKFMVWTLAPRHRLATSGEMSQRANAFVQWVKDEWLVEDGNPHPNIIIFDFFGLVAELNQNPENGIQYCLKYDYERSHTGSDSHPDTAANLYVGPILAQAIVDAFENRIVPVTSITVTGAGGATAITIDDGTLQLSAAVLPSNASDKTVTWSVQNGTGQATISSSGVVTAVADGTVIARATANDGSNVYDDLTINLINQNVTNIINNQNHGLTIDYNLSTLKINIGNDGENLYFVSIFNLHGILLKHHETNEKFIEIDTSNLPSGIYILKIFSKMGYTISSIIIN